MHYHLRSTLLVLSMLCTPLATAGHSDQAPTAKQLADFNRIDQSINALSQALNHIGEEKKRQDFAAQMLRAASNYQSEARGMLETGHPDDARQHLDQAMVTIKTAIATLRNRETLIRSLNFDNPKDEYHYELDRFHTYSMLVNLLLDRTKPDAGKRDSIKMLMEKAWETEGSARQLAEGQQYVDAIKAQEQSNKFLLQAIRRGGIYVPG